MYVVSDKVAVIVSEVARVIVNVVAYVVCSVLPMSLESVEHLPVHLCKKLYPSHSNI